MREKDLIATLRDWLFISKRIGILRDRLAAHNYSITACYSATGGSLGGGVATSEVERYCITRAKIVDELNSLEETITSVSEALKIAKLSLIERELITGVMNGRSMTSIAKENGIYISRVYKIRDRAIRKILAVFKR
jgi:hypothetical protein